METWCAWGMVYINGMWVELMPASYVAAVLGQPWISVEGGERKGT